MQNPLDEVSDHVIKIEFQAMGSPHAHYLLWVKGTPHTNNDSNEEVCAFIDEYISGMILGNSPECKYMKMLVIDYETHSHSEYCRQNGSCHFGFQKVPSPCTLICRENEDESIQAEMLKMSSKIIDKVHVIFDEKEEILKIEYLFQRADVSEEDYIKCLKVACKGEKFHNKMKPM